MAHAIRYSVPRNIIGSPSWHYNHLTDLRQCVTVHGLPTLFMTLTTDECSDTAWLAFGNIEEMLLKLGHPNPCWSSAPIESARTFHARFTEFFHRYIIPKSSEQGGICGRVQHYVVRYECQGRGSLHAHIMLWIHPADVDDISSR